MPEYLQWSPWLRRRQSSRCCPTTRRQLSRGPTARHLAVAAVVMTANLAAVIVAAVVAAVRDGEWWKSYPREFKFILGLVALLSLRRVLRCLVMVLRARPWQGAAQPACASTSV